MPKQFDYILVGGGLQNSLMMMALTQRSPTVRIAIVERDDRIGGNHTWSFHDSDIPFAAKRWFEPLVTYRWPCYQIRFPHRERTIELGYATVVSDDLHNNVMKRAKQHGHVRFLFGRTASDVQAHQVLLDDGQELNATVVIDARGPGNFGTQLGFQKFVGLEVELSKPLTNPIPTIMDATIPQVDGFCFMYMLPFEPHRCLFEETYFSDSPTLDVEGMHHRVESYIARAGHQVQRLVRTEHGVLPMPWRMPVDEPPDHGPFVAGYQGGWFHPATAYSLPMAVRLAEFVADCYPNPPFGASLSTLARSHHRQVRFASLLNWLLFRMFKPEMRWAIFERFYGLPEETLARFFALEMTTLDRLRVMCGKPPKGMSLRQLFSGHDSRANL